ncbi:hypothetical protein ONS96_005485 [Cadophora gregata f. sp. sojae]|nr:hypothetical protein ONS96_005485 [Cadophora gregata f. sp. sojae]
MDLDDHLACNGDRNILDYLTWFVQWLYTAKLNYDKDLRFFEMWLFASKIECPKLQNAAVVMLSRDALWRSSVSLEEKKRQYYFANSDFYESLTYCVGPFISKKTNHTDGFEKDGKLEVSYWEDKKCWLFLLDCAAYFGPGDRRVRSVFGESETLDIQIIKRMIDLAKEGGEACPWDAKNISRYFVSEPARRGEVKEEGSMLPPPLKHGLSSTVSNESNKRPKISTASKQRMAVVGLEHSPPMRPVTPLNFSQDEPA